MVPILLSWLIGQKTEGEESRTPEFLEKGLEKKLAQILGPAQTKTQSMQV